MNTVLWDREPHTAAKHVVLRAYLDAWIPIMAHQALRSQGQILGRPRLLLVDGFAGPGRYAGGERGSPKIMLDALMSHSAFGKFGGVDFLFLFIEKKPEVVAHLRTEIASLGALPANVKVRIEEGSFEEEFGRIVGTVHAQGKNLIPTFAFVDPFGYAHASMTLASKFLAFPRCEALFFLPLSFVTRFVGRDGQDAAMTSLFGCDDWRSAIDLSGGARRDFLLALFESQLAKQPSVAHVRSVQLRTQDGNDYRLVFGLGHIRGLHIAKDAMWKVDPVGGTSYTAKTDSGQEVLFAPVLETGPLLRELRARFGTEWFTIEEAETCTVLDTPYRKEHLRRATLQPAVRDGVLAIERPGSGFVGSRMRFMS